MGVANNASISPYFSQYTKYSRVGIKFRNYCKILFSEKANHLHSNPASSFIFYSYELYVVSYIYICIFTLDFGLQCDILSAAQVTFGLHDDSDT